MSFHKTLFVLTHQSYDKRFISLYRHLMDNLNKDYQVLIKEQNRKLSGIVTYAYHNVPYYHKQYSQLGINPGEIRTREDLKQLPILTKQEVKKFHDAFVPEDLSRQDYLKRSTGGSTGLPLHYRLSKYDHLMSGCLLYRGWSYAGYRLGDKMVFLGGASLGVGTNKKIIEKIKDRGRNITKLSSFDMNEENILEYRQLINKLQPKYIRGYPSSLFFFSKWLQDKELSIYSPTAVLTTAEKLTDNMRIQISDVFNCPVYEAYGLNDGGVSAFELPDQSGMRIDTERAVLEIVDDSGKPILEGTGRIIATSLLNYALPFIRYDTGDIGTIKVDDGVPKLTQILGRQYELLETPEGEHVYGGFFSHIFWDVKNVNRFQVRQIDLHHIVIKIVPEEGFSNLHIEKITGFIHKKCPSWIIQIDLVDEIEPPQSGKHIFVINDINRERGST
jgi:phenylacetate-CoA ligase